jgi:hypothetical protein
LGNSPELPCFLLLDKFIPSISTGVKHDETW